MPWNDTAHYRPVNCFEKPISKDLKVRQFCWLYLRFEWTSRQRRDLMVKSLTLIKNALSNGKLEKENYEFRAHSALNYQPQLDWNSGTGCSEIGLRCEFTLTSIQLLLKLIEACFDRIWDPYSSQGASLRYIGILDGDSGADLIQMQRLLYQSEWSLAKPLCPSQGLAHGYKK